MNILIINGPNLNLLGTREPDIYGKYSYKDLEHALKKHARQLNVTVDIHQTNFEGIIIDLLHYAITKPYHGIILNAAALSHYSYAIYDAIKAISIPVINVHLTNPNNRKEVFRHNDVIKDACLKTFKGEGIQSYLNAMSFLHKESIV
ncbi:MAG: type II 3-dehydroquinate dehydratase [Candidatus Izemoplasmataceae bacterium]